MGFSSQCENLPLLMDNVNGFKESVKTNPDTRLDNTCVESFDCSKLNNPASREGDWLMTTKIISSAD